MAAADQDGPSQDHYRLLGVARDAPREEITRAWRRQARAEHPDRRPGQAGDEATDRFRALAEAYRVLSDPARRGAYDRALGGGRGTAGMPQAVPVPVRVAGPGVRTGPGPVPGAPLRAGPVRVYSPPGAPDNDDARLAALAALALRCLARDADWPRRDRYWPRRDRYWPW